MIVCKTNNVNRSDNKGEFWCIASPPSHPSGPWLACIAGGHISSFDMVCSLVVIALFPPPPPRFAFLTFCQCKWKGSTDLAHLGIIWLISI